MLKNYFFLGINAIMIAGQILIIFFGSSAFSVVVINGNQWAICVIVAAFSLPAAVIIRYIPDEFVRVCWNHSVVFFTPAVNGLIRGWHAIPRREKKSKKSTDEEKGKSPEVTVS